MAARGKLVLTSQGLNSRVGLELIKRQISKDSLSKKIIWLFYEPYYSFEPVLLNACMEIGFCRENIILSSETEADSKIYSADYIYITEGNTFEILKILKERRLLRPIKEAIMSGTCYIGASAGAMIAGKDIAMSMDENWVNHQDLGSLCLVEGAILPHTSKKKLLKILKEENSFVNGRYQRIYPIADGKILVL